MWHDSCVAVKTRISLRAKTMKIRNVVSLGLTVISMFVLANSASATPIVIDSGGALGTQLTPGLVDVDGDGTNDINFVSFGADSGFLDSVAPYGLVGNIGGGPGAGAAWVRNTSNIVTGDGVGRNEIIAAFRGAVWPSDDNWSKVHFSSGDGWVQWEFGAVRSIVTPLVFVREMVGEDLSAAQAHAFATDVPEPTTLALLGLGIAGLGWSRRKQHS